MITDQIQKLAFIIVCFIIISGNSVTHILSCQTQKFLSENVFIKHMIGFLLIFIFMYCILQKEKNSNENEKIK